MAHFFLPLAITIVFLSLTITMAMDDTLVLDVYGNPLEAGVPYYVRDEISKVGIYGGLVVASKPMEPKCPQFVGRFSVGWYQEAPLMFYPSDPSQKHVHVSSDLSIVFNTTTSGCPQGAWQLSPDANSGNVFISTGGVVGNPTTQNLFKIERREYITDYPDFYQINHCPTSNTDDIMCGKIDSIYFSEELFLSWFGVTPSLDGFSTHLSFIKA